LYDIDILAARAFALVIDGLCLMALQRIALLCAVGALHNISLIPMLGRVSVEREGPMSVRRLSKSNTPGFSSLY
jgi:hypothetical protein